MRKYEIMVIVDPDVDDRQVPALIENHLKVITGAGGKVDNIDMMGRSRLAYDIKKKSEGFRVVVNLDAESATIKELDRRMTIDEKVLRTKVFRLDAK
ncbi:MAG TPA: 30S ribosomal protein S6 [Propionibacteriaceae bacterium]|nr:30S ribosomal protein S6 [Propionibacteriaceae bacterium]HPZ48445.1 30S ribosomal protein S6 [Propionibacteriaceae bacterium]HQE31654.1 30S ribosomal protein S6 [Propionibacteriaceae bacterium]